MLGVAPAGADPITLGTTSDFVLLALNNGYLSINSATSISGNVGASSSVDIASAQKVDTFIGSTYLYSGSTTTDFTGTYADATFNPTGGIHSGNTSGCPADPLFSCDGASVNNKLNQANADAAALQAQLAGLSYASLGAVTDSLNLTSGPGGLNAFDASLWNYNADTLTLHGDASSWFVFRINGTSNNWAHAQTILDGVLANHVLFYFTGDTSLGADVVDIYKDDNVFSGTIFAPFGGVDYHNPATFNGRIIAESITVHSDFNITAVPTRDITEIPEPASIVLLGSGLAALARRRLRSQKLQ
jgi:hypothetical protein